MADKFESRFRCSGGRLRGCKSSSAVFFRRDDEVGELGAVFCLTNVLLERGLTSPACWGETAAAAVRPPFCEDLLGDFFGDLSGELGWE
jgi:hypothetical protein